MHCLTVDLEEHFQVSAFDSSERRRHWEEMESRVETNTQRLLDLFAARQIRVTFVILGWVAERHPDLVRAIATGGHEIASHGYAHEVVTSQTPAKFREDVRKAKAILEGLTGGLVLGYRAPSFTITRDTTWALPILVEEGYAYDSSIVPIVHDRYGMPGANPEPHCLATTAGPLWEVPPSTVRFAGMQVPVAGGGYLRLYPFPVFQWLASRVAATQPLVIFVHPWELDPAQPRMPGSRFSSFRHYRNLEKTEARLRRLLDRFRFAPIREAIAPVGRSYEERRARREVG
jgi:polysaccharide deacetylase family protein (PEP-CTERM system associated)